MIGTIMRKPVDEEQFAEVMAWCCVPVNGARMMEYQDRYEVVEAPEESEDPVDVYEPVSIEERLNDIENALVELAEIIAGGE